MRCWLPMLFAAAALGQPAPTVVARSDSYTEGPVFDYRGALYFSNATSVMKLAPEGRWSRGSPMPAQASTATRVLPDGTHLICAMRRAAVLRFAPDGRPLGAASSECEGKALRAPNDLTLDPAGGFYFTDPGGSRDAPIGSVQYVDTSGKTHLAAGVCGCRTDWC